MSTKELVEISSVEDLMNIKSIEYNKPLDKHYVLTSDIDLWETRNNFDLPLAIELTGIFDGNGKTIKNYGGKHSLFKFIGETGVVMNLNISNFESHISPDVEYGYGILAFENDGTIENCSVSYSRISTSYKEQEIDNVVYVGTIVSSNCGNISGCSVNIVNIDFPGRYVGGIAGHSFDGIISDCHVRNCSLSGNKYIGGICGMLDYDGQLKNCGLNKVSIKRLTYLDFKKYSSSACGLIRESKTNAENPKYKSYTCYTSIVRE